jgi:hypothetical protein
MKQMKMKIKNIIINRFRMSRIMKEEKQYHEI